MADQNPQPPPLPPPPHGVPPPGESWHDPFAPPPRYAYGGPPPKKKRRIWLILLVVFTVVGGGLVTLLFLINLFLSPAGSGGGRIGFGARLGLLRIGGLMMPGDEMDFWIKSLHEMAESNPIRGIVIRIDSPGGAVGSSQEIYETIVNIREQWKKPVYVSMGDVAASGGYYVAAAADQIYSLRGTLTGSIGVIFSKYEIGEAARRLGLDNEVIKSGRFKDAGDIMRPMKDDERDVFQFLIQDAYEQFLEDILRFRREPLQGACDQFDPAEWKDFHLDKPEEATAEAFLRQLADGRVYSGKQALKLGMVDNLGTLKDTLDALARVVHIEGRPEIYEPERKLTLRDLLMSRVDQILPRARTPRLQYLMDLP